MYNEREMFAIEQYLEKGLAITEIEDDIVDIYVPPSSYIHPTAVIGSTGFGLLSMPEHHEAMPWYRRNRIIPHYGSVHIGYNVYIGPLSVIARATAKDLVTSINDNVYIDAHVHIAHNVVIMDNTRITAMTTVGGSAYIGKNCILHQGVIIRDHVRIADGVILGNGANVVSDITESNTVWVGNPARKLRDRRDTD